MESGQDDICMKECIVCIFLSLTKKVISKLKIQLNISRYQKLTFTKKLKDFFTISDSKRTD